MEQQKDLVEYLRFHRKGILIASIIIFILLSVLPVGIIAYWYKHGYSRAFQNFSAWSVWFYAVITLFTFFAVFLAALFAFNQMKSMQGQLKQQEISTGRIARQNAWDNLFSIFDMIDTYIARYEKEIEKAGLKEPYTPHSGQAAFLLLLHHIDLIYRYWIYQEFLTCGERQGFERWIDVVFFSWLVEKDNKEKLFEDYKVVIDRKDLYAEKFTDLIII